MSTRERFEFEFGVVSISLDDFRLSSGLGVYRFEIPIAHRASWLDGSSTDTAATLVTGVMSASMHGLHLVGALQPQVLQLRGMETASDDLVVLCSGEQLLALDAARRGGDIELLLDLTATVLKPPEGGYPSRRSHVRYRISSSEWQRLLDQNQIEVTLAVRVPMPLGALSHDLGSDDLPEDGSWVYTVTQLREARANFRDGRHRDALATSRRVLESLEQLIQIPTRDSLPAPRQRDPEQRWAALHWELKSLSIPPITTTPPLVISPGHEKMRRQFLPPLLR